MKKYTTYLKLLCALFFCFSFITVKAQNPNNDDKYPKGKFHTVETNSQNYTKNLEIYSSNADKILSEWNIYGFTTGIDKKKTVLTTGEYSPNKTYYAISPEIQLPNERKIIFQIEEKFKVESRYDYIYIQVSKDFGKTWSVVYGTSGKVNWRTNHIDISRFAGEKVMLSLVMTTDESIESDGWNIANINVFSTGSYDITEDTNAKNSSTKGPAQQARVREFDILHVYTENYPEAVFVDFTAKNQNGDFVSGLELTDLYGFDNGDRLGSCLKLVESNQLGSQDLDVVIIMDNSGSMGSVQQNVARNVDSLVRKLGDGNYNVRIALTRFGQYTSGGAPEVEANPNQPYTAFFYKTEEFLNFWHSINIQNGGWEPSYCAIETAATSPLIQFRPNCEKVFLLITDEHVSNGSNHCSVDQTSAINILRNNNIRLFTICRDYDYFRTDFEPLCTASNGGYFPEILSDFSTVFDSLIYTMTGKYTLRYCPLSPQNPIDPNICIPLRLGLNNYPNLEDQDCYFPTPLPRLVRTPETRALDGTTQSRGSTIEVGVEILDAVDLTGVTVELFYRNYDGGPVGNFSPAGNIQRQGNSNIWKGTIPSSIVQPYTVEYYFVAHFPNRSIKSPIENQEFFAWTFAVNPNFAPAIYNVRLDPTEAVPCQDLEIKANIVDGTDYLTKTKLFYKPNNSLSGWIILNMAQTSTNEYTGIIPGHDIDASGVSYFIYAEDNYRTQGWYGTPDAPMQIPIVQRSLSTYQPMRIFVYDTENITVGCGGMGGNDIVKAYFTNDCGQLQEAGSGQYNPLYRFIQFDIYMDDPNTLNYKDGFANGELVTFKLIRNGRDYDLDVVTMMGATQVFFTPNWSEAINALQGVGNPVLALQGNGRLIPHNDISPSTDDGTDFGYNNSQIMHTFNVFNTGCENLVISGITLGDNANFSVNNISQSTIPPNGSAYFNVTYNATQDAQTTVSIASNSPTNPFKFDIAGQVGSSPTGFTLHPNPVGSSQSGTTVTFEITGLREGVSIYLYDAFGTLMSIPLTPTVFVNGVHTHFINTQGLPTGTYIVKLRKSGVDTSQQIIVN